MTAVGGAVLSSSAQTSEFSILSYVNATVDFKFIPESDSVTDT